VNRCRRVTRGRLLFAGLCEKAFIFRYTPVRVWLHLRLLYWLLWLASLVHTSVEDFACEEALARCLQYWQADDNGKTKQALPH
jgi:hypothetical protein